MSCKCENVEVGSYSNQSILKYPDWFESAKSMRECGVDNCILDEILSLWQNGVQTVESCCGHNKHNGYISVVDNHADKMIALGYQPYQSNFRNESGWDGNGYRRDTFKPKTV